MVFNDKSNGKSIQNPNLNESPFETSIVQSRPYVVNQKPQKENIMDAMKQQYASKYGKKYVNAWAEMNEQERQLRINYLWDKIRIVVHA